MPCFQRLVQHGSLWFGMIFCLLSLQKWTFTRTSPFLGLLQLYVLMTMVQHGIDWGQKNITVCDKHKTYSRVSCFCHTMVQRKLKASASQSILPCVFPTQPLSDLWQRPSFVGARPSKHFQLHSTILLYPTGVNTVVFTTVQALL